MDIKDTLNELLVKLFRNINTIEEQAIRTEEYRDMTTNDMHVIEAIGRGEKYDVCGENTGGYDGDSDDFGKQPGEKRICGACPQRRGQACGSDIPDRKGEKGLCPS